VIGPDFVVSQGNSEHAKQCPLFLLNAQVQIAQNLLSLGTHPASPLGHSPFTIFGHISHAMPQTLIFICNLSSISGKWATAY